MKPIGTHNYYVYILTNESKTALYIGVTNNLGSRLFYHKDFSSSNKMSFVKRYKCFFLIYYERFDDITNAISREKQLKKWSRKKKEILIHRINPNWDFLNETIK